MRGTIEVEELRCKGCELCVSVCNKNVIEMAPYFNAKGYHPAMLVDPDGACTGCLLCSTICPEAAITVYREKDTRKAAKQSAAVANEPKAQPVAVGIGG